MYMPLKSQMYIEIPAWLITRRAQQEHRQVLKQECMACQLEWCLDITPAARSENSRSRSLLWKFQRAQN